MSMVTTSTTSTTGTTGTTDTPQRQAASVELQPQELNAQGGVFCPGAGMKLWNSHPKVYLNVAASGSARCPYCGTVYRLQAGAQAQAAH